MKQSLSKDSSTTEQVDEAAIAMIGGEEDQYAVAVSPTFKIGAVSGEIQSSDLIVPRLTVGHEKSKPVVDGLCEMGDLILNMTTTIVPVKVKCDVVFIKADKYYKDNIPFSPSNTVMPTIYHTYEEVVAAGKTTQWVNDQAPTVNEVVDATLLIKRPEGHTSSAFLYEMGGDDYAMALWTIERSAYKSVAKPLFTALHAELARRGLAGGSFRLWNEPVRNKKGFDVITPKLQFKEYNSEEFMSDLAAQLGG